MLNFLVLNITELEPLMFINHCKLMALNTLVIKIIKDPKVLKYHILGIV